jgi:hypothetical protein
VTGASDLAHRTSTRCRRCVVTIATAVAVAMFVLSATTPAATAESSMPSDPTAAGRQYLHAIFGGTHDPRVLIRATKFAEPGSDAYAYVEFQADRAVAVQDAGRSPTSKTSELRTLQTRGTKIVACRVDDRRDCATFAGFRLGPSGKVESFTIDGNPLSGRIVAGPSQHADVAGASFRLLVAYQAASDDLAVVGVVSADGSGPKIDLLNATYVGPDGRLVALAVESSNMPLDPLPARSRATAALAFPASKVGGRLRIPLTDVQGNTSTLELGIAPNGS